jgi:hypothetical protein
MADILHYATFKSMGRAVVFFIASGTTTSKSISCSILETLRITAVVGYGILAPTFRREAVKGV